MMTGKRAPDRGRKTSALSPAPSRMGISRSFSTMRSWRGCDARWRGLANRCSARSLLDLELVVADEFRPDLRLGANLLGEFLRWPRNRDGHQLLRKHFFRLCTRQAGYIRCVQLVGG